MLDKVRGLAEALAFWYAEIYIRLRTRKFDHDRAIELANCILPTPSRSRLFAALLWHKNFDPSNGGFGGISDLFAGLSDGSEEILYEWLTQFDTMEFAVSNRGELEVLCDLSAQLSGKKQLYDLIRGNFVEDNADLRALRDLMDGAGLGGATSYETIVSFGNKMNSRNTSVMKELCLKVGGQNRLAGVIALYDCFRKQFDQGGAGFKVEDIPGFVERMCVSKELAATPTKCVEDIDGYYDGDAYTAYTASERP